jgi:hypothetical protein
LVLFGLLDSHTQFSDYANMRIDKFVYPMGRRLSEMLEQTFGKPPLVFYAGSSYTPAAICFATPSGRIDEALGHDASLADFVFRNRFKTDSAEVPVTTDDWPYLYQQNQNIPRTYLAPGSARDSRNARSLFQNSRSSPALCHCSFSAWEPGSCCWRPR